MRIKVEQIDVPASKIIEYLLVIKAKRDRLHDMDNDRLRFINLYPYNYERKI